MDKKKAETAVLIVLMAIMINYGLYTYYVKPAYEEVKAAQQFYNNVDNEVGKLEQKSRDLTQLKKRVEEEKKSMNSSTLLSTAFDNQTIIKEFYNACKQYGIEGSTLQFSKGTAEGGNVENSQSSQASGGNTQDNASQNESMQKLMSQTITLTISGDKGKVENFIENIRKVSQRKLLVSGVNITALDPKGIDIINSEETSSEKVSAVINLVEFIYSGSEDNTKAK